MKKLLFLLLLLPAVLFAQVQVPYQIPGPYKNINGKPSDFYLYDNSTGSMWASTSAVTTAVVLAERFPGQQFIVNVSGTATRYEFKTAADCTSGTLTASGGGGGGVSSVSGTTNRITSTGGSAPVIDISSTFEALLGKIANPLSQFASTTSSQFAGIISDETGTGSVVLSNSPTLTGTVTVPTQTQGDNSTKAATTAYVDAAVSNTASDIYYHDTFTRADNASTLGSTEDAITPWTNQTNVWGIVSNQAYITNAPTSGAVTYSVATIDAGSGDYNVEASVFPQTNFQNGGIIFRYSGSNDFWFARYYQFQLDLYKVVAGTATSVYNYPLSGNLPSTPQKLKLELKADRITFYLNGAYLTSVYDSFNKSATLVGLGVVSGAGFVSMTNMRFDDFLLNSRNLIGNTEVPFGTPTSSLTSSPTLTYNLETLAVGDIAGGTNKPGILVSKSIADAFTLRAFQDRSVKSGPSGSAWCSFDGFATLGTSNNFDHIVSFQARSNIATSSPSVLGNSYGLATGISNGTGTITNNYGVYAFNPNNGSGGIITNNYALYSEAQTAGVNNWGIWIDGATPSYFGGLTTFNSSIKIPSGANSGYVLTSDASGNATWAPGGGGSTIITDATTARTLTNGDDKQIIRFTNSSPVIVTLANGLNANFTATIIKAGTGDISFTAIGTLTTASPIIQVQGNAAVVEQYTTNTWEVLGSLGPAAAVAISDLADATDADFTMTVNSSKYLPAATLTQNRNITIPTGSNGDTMEFYNNEAGFVWLLIGGSVYQSDGSTVITSLLANTNYLIKKKSGKWRILN